MNGGTKPPTIARRELIVALGGALAWPLAARAQQPATPVIGFLSSRGLGDSANVLGEFHRGLSEPGLIAGQNAAIEGRVSNPPCIRNRGASYMIR
jgi:putative ABC transport system substrate-binding protein